MWLQRRGRAPVPVGRGAAVIAILSVLSCKGLGPESALEGTWGGNLNGAQFTLTLHEDQDAVSGGGRISLPNGDAIVVGLSGTHIAAQVAMVFVGADLVPFSYEATVAETGKSMSGRLDGSGFAGDALTITRP